MGNEKKTGSVKIGGNLKKAFRFEGTLVILSFDVAAPLLGCVGWYVLIVWSGYNGFEDTMKGN